MPIVASRHLVADMNFDIVADRSVPHQSNGEFPEGPAAATRITDRVSGKGEIVFHRLLG